MSLVLVRSWGKVAISVLVAVNVLTYHSIAMANAMDNETRNLLIKKFEKVLIQLSPSDSSYSSVTLRVADLLADRARVMENEAYEKGLNESAQAKQDRTKALKLYEGIITKLPPENQGRVMFQVGHLYERLGKSAQAEQTYSRLSTTADGALRAEASAALGEMYFKKRDYSRARQAFETARRGELQQKGLASYRIAWCLFNEGNIKAGSEELKAILQNPNLLTRSASTGVVSVDTQFQAEVARDLATFYARMQLGKKEAIEIFELSPDSDRMANVAYYAGELERLGAKKAAAEVWSFVADREKQPRARLEAHIHLGQLLMESNATDAAQTQYSKSLALYSSACNGQTDCAELKTRLRKFPTDWNRMTKENPPEALVESYEQYLEVFADDRDMAVWGAQAAKQKKSYDKALELLATAQAAALKEVAKSDKDAAKNLETVLLLNIDIAELSNDSQKMAKAYENYLKHSRVQSKMAEVRYQQAHLVYKAEKYAEAAQLLRNVAVDSTLPQQPDVRKIKIQAADLALDALVLAKNEAQIQSWSNEFAKIFPEQSADFSKVSRKASFNRVANLVGDINKADKNNLESAWTQLMAVDVRAAEEQDKILYLKNKMLIAEKLGKWGDARVAADQLLQAPNLSNADRELALSRKIYFAELALDFGTAYNLSQKVALNEMKPDQKALRLALFAELAAQDPRPHLEKYLSASQDQDAARAVAARLVRESKNPIKELTSHKARLKQDPSLYSLLLLETYASTRSPVIYKEAESDKALSSQASALTILRGPMLEKIKALGTKLSQHAIDSKSQKTVAAGIRQRAQMLTDLENMAGKAIELKDWALQVAALSYLGKESERFYGDLLSLPMPQGLSPEEEQQYLSLLSQQASPYQTKAQDIQAKLNEFWSSGAENVFKSEVENADLKLAALFKEQLAIVAEVAPANKKSSFDILSKPASAGDAPSLKDLELARDLVRKSPFDRSAIENLMTLERKAGRHSMVSYLEARLKTLGGAQ